jgi:FkbM family methyltransferase
MIKNLICILFRLRKIGLGKDVLFLPKRTNYKLITLGNEGGSWTICPELLSLKSIVYSVGVGNDISFDLELINKLNVTIFAYDPTPKCIEWLINQQLPVNFKFSPFALSHHDGNISFNLPDNPEFVSASNIQANTSKKTFSAEAKRLSTIMQNNNHSKIDLLKIDIEGAEYDVIDDILKSNIEITQFLIEFHHRFKEIGVNKTKLAVKKLENAGYKLVYINQKTGEEYTFIKK